MQYGFYAAAAFNIFGILAISRLFTNEILFDVDPALFSAPGCVLIAIWGLCYAALARDFARAPWVSLVFALEKLFYGVWWLNWLSKSADTLPQIFEADPSVGLFFATYGAGDLLFAGFFAYAWWRSISAQSD